MKIVIPGKLKVGVHIYTISTQKDYQEIENYCGSTNKSTLKIIIDINPLKPDSLVGEYFIHELLHAAFNQAGYNQVGNKEFTTTEEEIIGRLTPAIHQILVDNKIQEEVKNGKNI